MRQVTQIEKISGSRSRVYIDHEFAFVLYKGELRRYHIKEQESITEEDYQTICETVLPKRAKLRAMHLLEKREYTQKQLADKLRQQYYPAGIIEEAIAYVKSYHYIDDERYARDYINGQLGRRSRRRIEEDLNGKGISRELTAELFSELEPDVLRQTEWNSIQELLRKKKYHPEEADYKEKQKVMDYLCRKGFSPDTVRTAMKCQEEWAE